MNGDKVVRLIIFILLVFFLFRWIFSDSLSTSKTPTKSVSNTNTSDSLNNLSRNPGEYKIKVGYYFGCTEQDLLAKICNLIIEKDDVAFENAMMLGIQNGSVIKFKDNQLVFLEKSDLIHDYVKIRLRGQDTEFWTYSDAIEKCSHADYIKEYEHKVDTAIVTRNDLPSNSTSVIGRKISKHDLGEDWPFKVDNGIIGWEPLEDNYSLSMNIGMITFIVGNKIYAVNGTAKTHAKKKGFLDINKIWKDFTNLSPIVDEGLKLGDVYNKTLH